MEKGKTTRRLNKTLLLLLLLTISSCTGDTLCHHYAHIPQGGWFANDTLSFDIPAAKTSGTYTMNIEMRTTPSFQYQSMTMVRQVLLSHPQDTVRDTVCISTSHNGRRLSGDGVTTQAFSQSAPEVHIDSGQHARILLHHIMANGPIQEITDVGIRMELAHN